MSDLNGYTGPSSAATDPLQYVAYAEKPVAPEIPPAPKPLNLKNEFAVAQGALPYMPSYAPPLEMGRKAVIPPEIFSTAAISDVPKGLNLPDKQSSGWNVQIESRPLTGPEAYQESVNSYHTTSYIETHADMAGKSIVATQAKEKMAKLSAAPKTAEDLMESRQAAAPAPAAPARASVSRVGRGVAGAVAREFNLFGLGADRSLTLTAGRHVEPGAPSKFAPNDYDTSHRLRISGHQVQYKFTVSGNFF